MKITRRDLLMSTTALAVGGSALALSDIAAAAAATPWQLPKKRPFKVIENQWIPLRDGSRLASRLWLPNGSESTPVPVVLEYLPYRKRDVMRERDSTWAEAFVPYGFAFVRVDIRGSGESDGVLTDEYLPQEQADAVEVIAWLARQPWCNGSVGMRGISWGGFNSLQVAAKAPPELKAIVTQCATDNRYTDDSHYLGGSLTFDMLNWGAQFKTFLAAPPDIAIVGERWREMWQKRLDSTQPVFANWLKHQRFDAFWKQGSVATDYTKIKCPVYIVGGQIDSYRDFIPRLMSNLSVPHKGMMGPWGHRFPHNADPGPGLDWAAEETRWWSQWLLGLETGIMKDPPLQAYMEYRIASEVWPLDTPGRWVAEDHWPPTDIKPTILYLGAGQLVSTSPPPSLQSLHSRETLGITRREWFPNIFSSDLPPDQTPDDEHSLTFDSAPLTHDMEILGRPTATVWIASNKPVAKLAVRVNEVTPDGKSWSVTYGILNLTHRNGHENPEPLEPGRRYQIDVACYFTAHRFRKGSRIRVALSESLWPMVWPSPEPVTLELEIGQSCLSLPVRAVESSPYQMPIAILRDQSKKLDLAEAKSHYTLTQTGPDASGTVVLHKVIQEPSRTLDTGTTIDENSDWYWSIREGDPNSSVWKMMWSTRIKRDTWDTTLRGSIELTSTATEFHVKESTHALEGDKRVFEKEWNTIIPRDFM